MAAHVCADSPAVRFALVRRDAELLLSLSPALFRLLPTALGGVGRLRGGAALAALSVGADGASLAELDRTYAGTAWRRRRYFGPRLSRCYGDRRYKEFGARRAALVLNLPVAHVRAELARSAVGASRTAGDTRLLCLEPGARH